jgi:gas vesicle structural protein
MGEQASRGGLIDVLDRVLDKGVVIDAHVRVGIVGVELIAVEARVVVASIETYLAHAEAISYTSSAARPRLPDAPPALPPGAVPPLLVETVAESAESEATPGDDETPPLADDELPTD